MYGLFPNTTWKYGERSICAFREDLIRVPVCAQHDGGDCGDVLVWNTVLKEIAHAVDEDRLWSGSYQERRRIGRAKIPNCRRLPPFQGAENIPDRR